MRLRIKDETYDLDVDRITVAEARTLKRHTDTTRDGSGGMGVNQLRQGLLNGDPDVMVFLMWLAKTRANERVSWSTFDDYDLVSDAEILADEDDASDEGDEEEDIGEAVDPTGAGGRTRTTGTSPTSRRSRSTSTSTRGKSKS